MGNPGLNVVDEYTHECLAIRVERRLRATDVIDVLSDLLVLRGVPGHVRSDNGPEFVAKAVQEWITAVGANRLHRPGQPPPGPPTWPWSLRDRIDSAAVDGRTGAWRASTPGSGTVGSAAANLDGEIFDSLRVSRARSTRS